MCPSQRETVGKQEAVVQIGPPPDEAGRRERLVPEPPDQGPQQELLRQAHPRVRRHLEGAQFQEPEASRRLVGRIQLVYAKLGPVGVAGHIREQIPEDPVNQPGRGAAPCLLPFQLAEGDLELVQAVVPRLVDPRGLAGGADEQAREEVTQRWVLVPVGHQASQQVRPPQKGAVRRAASAYDDVIAASRAPTGPTGVSGVSVVGPTGPTGPTGSTGAQVSRRRWSDRTDWPDR